jgi:tyrosine-protein kinase Etk/Wzc
MSDMSEPVQTSHSSPNLSEDDEISLLDILQVVVENLRLLVFGSLIVGLIALGITYLIPPTFTATTKIMPPQQQQSSAAALLQNLGALGGLAGAATGIKNPNDQFVAFMQSRTVQDNLLKRFKLTERYEQKLSDDARTELSKNVRISSGKDGLITISADDKDPAFAAELANAHVSQLAELLSRLAVTEAQQRRVFFEKQLANAKENLTKAEQALQTTGVNAGALKANPAAAVGGLAQLQAGIAAQEIKVASMRGYLAESAPDFRQAMTELSALRAQLRRAEQTQSPVQAGDSDYIAKFRDFKYFETLFDLFAKQYELARVDESREGAVIQVLDLALPPERKSKPQKALIAVLAAVATGFLLLFFVFVRQGMRNAANNQATSQKLDQLRQSWRKTLGRSTR